MGMSSKPELLRYLINGFLEGEEALYSKMNYVSEVILKMEDGDMTSLHIIMNYSLMRLHCSDKTRY
jgi:hypothetical protein